MTSTSRYLEPKSWKIIIRILQRIKWLYCLHFFFNILYQSIGLLFLFLLEFEILSCQILFWSILYQFYLLFLWLAGTDFFMGILKLPLLKNSNFELRRKVFFRILITFFFCCTYTCTCTYGLRQRETCICSLIVQNWLVDWNGSVQDVQEPCGVRSAFWTATNVAWS